MNLKVIDANTLRFETEKYFKSEMMDLQAKYCVATDNLYTDTNSYPGMFILTKNVGVGMVCKVESKLINYIDSHHIYQEWGTGKFMADFWSPSKTESQLAKRGSSPRQKPRPGMEIGGRNAPWVGLAGERYQGWHKLVFEIDGHRVVAETVPGNPPQHRLKNRTETFLHTSRLRYLAQRVLKNAFRSASTKMRVVKK